MFLKIIDNVSLQNRTCYYSSSISSGGVESNADSSKIDWSFQHVENEIAADVHESYPFTDIIELNGQRIAMSKIEALEDYEVTPLIRASESLSRACGVGSILIKDEGSRLGLGSFKGLGGILAVENIAEQAEREGLSRSSVTVTTASAGNHGIGVASGASRAGVACVVYVHGGVSENQADRMRSYGAKVVRVDGNYEDSLRQCANEANSRDDWFVVQDVCSDGYEDVPKRIWEGYSVVAAEMIDQLEAADECLPTHVFVNTGVGGFATALCAHFWERLGHRRPIFVTVEPTAAACHLESALAGRPTAVSSDETTVQVGLDCKEVDPLSYRVLSKGANHFLAVPDSSVAPCMSLLHEQEGVVAGASGVAGLAALLSAGNDLKLKHALSLDEESRVAIIVCETLF